MNHCIIGKPRNGKGRFGIWLIADDEIAHSDRIIITNLAVEKNPWVTSDHKPRRGLLSYLQKKYKKTFKASQRIFRLTDDAIGNFFLYRGLSNEKVVELQKEGKHLVGYREVTPEDGVLVPSEWQYHTEIKLFVADHTFHNDKRGRKVVDTFDTRLHEYSGGHSNMIDEAWSFWPARGWSSTGEGVLFHFSQVGKFSDDNWIITHRINDCDSILIDKCQDFYQCTNHAKMRIGPFKQPPVFTVAIYNQKPIGPSIEPVGRKVFQLDKEGLSQCYDTSAGVGVSGRVAADIGIGAKGLPFWLIGVLGVIAIVGVVYLVKGGGKMLGSVLGGKKVAGIVATNTPALAMKAGDSTSPKLSNANATNEVFCVGVATVGRSPYAYFSDGSVYTVNDGLTMVTADGCQIGGQFYKIKSVPQKYVPRVSRPVEPIWVPAPEKPVNQVTVGPSIHHQGGDSSSPALHGLRSMQGASSSRPSYSGQ